MGYSGDECEIVPEPVYEMICEDLQPLNECEDMGSEVRKWLGRQTVDDGTCLDDCQAYAVENNLKGCCFQNSHPTNRNCRFFDAQHHIELQDKPSNAYKDAYECCTVLREPCAPCCKEENLSRDCTLQYMLKI